MAFWPIFSSCANLNILCFIKGQLLNHVCFVLGFVGCLKEGKRMRNNPERQKMLIEEFKTKTLPDFLDLFQKLLEANGGKFLVGSDVCFDTNYMNVYLNIIAAFIYFILDFDI